MIWRWRFCRYWFFYPAFLVSGFWYCRFGALHFLFKSAVFWIIGEKVERENGGERSSEEEVKGENKLILAKKGLFGLGMMVLFRS